MKRSWAEYRTARSFVAGLLIGIAIVVPLLAVAGAADGQVAWLMGALVLAAVGIALQIAAVVEPQYGPATGPQPRAMPVCVRELSHQP